MYILPKNIYKDIVNHLGYDKDKLAEKLGLVIGTVKNIPSPTTGMSPDGLRIKAELLGFYLELEMTNKNIKDFRIFDLNKTEISDFKRVYSKFDTNVPQTENN